jgi:hypothetical protein
MYLKPRIRIGWPYWIAAWIIPGIMTILGAAIFFAAFPQYFDPSLRVLMNLTNQASQASWMKALSPSMLVLLMTLQAIALSPFINGLFAFGEEFGWRAYLLPKLLPLDGRKGDSNSGRYLGHMALASYCNGTQLWIRLSRRSLDWNDGNGMVHCDSGNLLRVGDLAQWKRMARSYRACRCQRDLWFTFIVCSRTDEFAARPGSNRTHSFLCLDCIGPWAIPASYNLSCAFGE